MMATSIPYNTACYTKKKLRRKPMVIPKWLLVIALLASGSEHVTEREGMIPEMSTEIELTLTNELPFEREAEPVTCGVPLARGLADHADELMLLGPDGRSVPVQAQTTSTYKDNTPRITRRLWTRC
jgi:hypothetical protein